MKSSMSAASDARSKRSGLFRRWLGTFALLAWGLSVILQPVQAQTTLADRPVFSAVNVPGNLALALSVEFPTAISVAHTNRTYSNTNEYLGYFDPSKCYDYRYTDGTSTDNYFYPSAVAAANHICTGKWSGNFLNWATMQTIDPFRWVLTGGYRVIDTPSLTVLEKAWGTQQGGYNNFPNSTLGSTMLAGATPFPASAVALYMRVWGLGNKMRFTLPDTSANVSFAGEYFNNKTLSGSPVLTRTDASIDFSSAPSGPGVNGTNMSVRWTGNVTAPVAGNYVFQTGSDDGVRLWVDGVQVINQWIDQGVTYYDSPAISASAGQVFSIKVEYYQGGGGAAMHLLWKKPGDPGFSVIGAPVSSLTATATPYNPNVSLTNGGVYEVFARAKVCDTAAPGGVEANCTAYGSNWKPEGLIQRYANKIRYSAFGYLNDSNIKRDGGVLRARQKFVGPTKPVPGSVAVTNLAKEWDPGTGQFVRDPDASDSGDTNTLFGPSPSVQDSGVMNYLNKFGEITPGSYKTYDNVSEMYYAAIRYFKNLGNVPEWTSMASASPSQINTWVDGFPVITNWDDPILYSCQRNFILGIGDVNTHADKNVPGNALTTNEPSMPALVSADSSVNAVTATNKVGALEGLGASLGTSDGYGGCCNNNSALMAGLAYDAHTKDIRPDDPATLVKTQGMQTIDTYWVDVQENQVYKNNNQFYLATKYGGFAVPLGYDPYTNTTALTESWWHTNTDTFGSNKRPDNYFSGGRPDLVKAGLEAAFSRIAAAITAYTTSFSTSLPQVATTGNKSYSSLYDPNNWTGEVTASDLSFDATTGNPILTQKWSFTTRLATQLAVTGSVVGWDTGRRIATWNGSGVAFRIGNLSTAQKTALDTSYVTGNDSANFLDYLRGDTKNEQASTVTGSTQAYRNRTKLLGDIVGSKARPVGPPSFPFSDATNPGYLSFKTTGPASTRPTVVYFGANDGMLHAVHGDLTAPPGGTEMFAYIPSALFAGPNGTPSVDGLASLGNPTFTHHFLVNATPNVYDIDFSRTADDTTKQLPATIPSPAWRSVLIGGLGKGGKSYYAIDVTDPAGMASGGESTVASKVLWEFTDSDLGYTFGDPIVVKTIKYGWVVILPSGYNNANGKGYFFVVNPRTGKLLEKIDTGEGSPTNDAGLAFANAFVVDSSDGTADAVYAGDLLGNVWRWDLTSAAPFPATYPAPVKIAYVTDASNNAQPITSRPVIEVHPTLKKRFVMFGTGRLLDVSDISSTQQQSFYAIADGTNARFNQTADLPTGITFPIKRTNLVANVNALAPTAFDPTTQMGWYEDLGTGGGIGWRVTTDPTTLAGSVAFATTLPNGSVCSPSGDSRVYGRDYAAGGTTVRKLNTVTNLLEASLFVPISGNVTDLRYLSVAGKATLISGTDTGNLQRIEINPQPNLTLRRLNWRELQVVE